MTQSHKDITAIRRCAEGNAALCTIVAIEGSFSRRLGAQLAVGTDGTIVGSLADGCIEQQLCREAEECRTSGISRIVRFGEGAKSIDYTLPCGSRIEVLVDPFPDTKSCQDVVRDIGDRKPALFELSLPNESTFLHQRKYIPPPRIVLCGTGPEADCLVTNASALGIEVDVHRPFEGGSGLSLGVAPKDTECDEWTAIVLLFHDHEWERALLEWALSTPSFYIGAQGGKAIRKQRFGYLVNAGYSDQDLKRISSPIGIIPHTRDPATLSLSAIADVVAQHEKLHPHN